jgi:hypothetical protein
MVKSDPGVAFDNISLKIPAYPYRCHSIQVKVNAHRYVDGSLVVFHGRRNRADYDPNGQLEK